MHLNDAEGGVVYEIELELIEQVRDFADVIAVQSVTKKLWEKSCTVANFKVSHKHSGGSLRCSRAFL